MRKPSALPRAGTLTGGELLEVEQNGAPQCLELDTLAEYVTLNSVAAEIDLAALAPEVSLPDLAAEFAVADIAAEIDLAAVAAEIDLTTQGGEEVMAADYTVTGSYADTGLSIDLPDAGTYLIGANVRVRIDKDNANDGAIKVRLYNVTATDAINDTERMCLNVPAADGEARESSAGFTFVVTVLAPTTVRLEAIRSSTGTPTWATSLVKSDSSGRTTLNYYKVA